MNGESPILGTGRVPAQSTSYLNRVIHARNQYKERLIAVHNQLEEIAFMLFGRDKLEVDGSLPTQQGFLNELGTSHEDHILQLRSIEAVTQSILNQLQEGNDNNKPEKVL